MPRNLDESLIGVGIDEEGAVIIDPEEVGGKIAGGSNRHNVNAKDGLERINDSLFARG